MLLFRRIFVFILFSSFFRFSLCVSKRIWIIYNKMYSAKCTEYRMYVCKVRIWRCIIIMLVGTGSFILMLCFLSHFRSIHFLRPFQYIPLHALLVSRFIHPFNFQRSQFVLCLGAFVHSIIITLFKAKMKLITCTNIYVP